MKPLRTLAALGCLTTLLVSRTVIADAATTTSSAQGVAVSATVTQSISVLVTPALANFGNLSVLGLTATGIPVTVTTTWSLNPSVTLNVYGYFTSATAALTDGASHNIPSSAVTASVNSATATAFTATSPFGAASSLSIYSVPITAANSAGSHIDTVSLNLNLAGLTNLPPATYTGTLYVEAQAL